MNVRRFLAALAAILTLALGDPSAAQQVVSDTITATGDKFEQPIGRAGSMGVQIEGTYNATLVFEVTGHADAATATWVGVDAFPTTGSAVTQTVCAGTCSDAWTIITSGFTHVRVRASAWSSGTATVRFIYPESGAYVPRSGGSFSGELTSPIGDNTKAASLSITWATDIDPMLIGPAASGGLGHPFRFISDGTDELPILAQPGQVYGFYCIDNDGGDGATDSYIKFYDKATAPAETDTPAAGPFGIPGHDDIAGSSIFILYGEVFANGIGIRVVRGIGDSDDTAVAANEVACNIWYVSS